MCILLLLKYCTQQDFCITCFNILKNRCFSARQEFWVGNITFPACVSKEEIGNSAVILKDFVSYKVHKCI